MFSYKETLDEVNEFMNESGIRSLCSDVCGGYCCNGARDDGKCNSLISCDDKLPCVCYLCTPLTFFLMESVSSECIKRLHDIRNEVLDILHNRLTGNPYYEVYSMREVEDITFANRLNISPEIMKEIIRVISDLRKRLLNIDRGYEGFPMIMGKRSAFFY